ncbi:hypothetical protein LINPERPRIM_LOCUS43938 [Linum perenne]
MGNCCKGASSSSAAVWAGDDWEEAVNQDCTVLFDATAAEKKRLIPAHDTSSSSSGTGREVKIKISRKELEELMSRAEELGLSSEQVLARLIFSDEQSHNNSNLVFHDMLQAELDHHRHWKPALQSIPELN